MSSHGLQCFTDFNPYDNSWIFTSSRRISALILSLRPAPADNWRRRTGAMKVALLAQSNVEFAWGSQHWLRALVAQRFEFGLEDVDLWSKSLLVDALLMTIWKWLGSVDGSTFETNRKHLVLYGVYCIYKQQWGKQVRPAINRSSLRVWGPKLPGLGDHCFPFLGYNVAGPPKL